MSELASYKGANAGDGWSPVGGQTVNVYVSCCPELGQIYPGRD